MNPSYDCVGNCQSLVGEGEGGGPNHIWFKLASVLLLVTSSYSVHCVISTAESNIAFCIETRTRRRKYVKRNQMILKMKLSGRNQYKKQNTKTIRTNCKTEEWESEIGHTIQKIRDRDSVIKRSYLKNKKSRNEKRTNNKTGVDENKQQTLEGISFFSRF
jgi:hypothetical protein